MKSTRLEVIADAPTVMHPPRMSRTLPAALYGYVTETEFTEFCNRLDPLLETLNDEYQRRMTRKWQMMYLYMGFYCLYVLLGLLPWDIPPLYGLVIMLLAVTFGCTTCCYSAPSMGSKNDIETMNAIRNE
jgi:hypothetical protein